MSSKITFESSEDEVLKGIVTEGIDGEVVLEDDRQPPVKVFKTIGGLTNLGRTYFWQIDELEDKRKWVEAQMVQKYGAEIYGTSAQLRNQGQDQTNSGATSGGLITCKVSNFVDLTHVKKESGNKMMDQFKDIRNKLKTFLEGKKKKDDWKTNHKIDDTEIDAVVKILEDSRWDKFDDKFKVAWKDLTSELKADNWKSLQGSDSDFENLYKKLKGIYDALNGGSSGDDKGKDHLGGSSVSGKGWASNMSMRIDIHTDFNETWYKRKFKSGFLNKVIDTVKTGIHARAYDDNGRNSEFKNKKFSADQMEDSDKRKLDSLQWKMTNKVAKDYISMLLGWSRKKEYRLNEDGTPIPTQETLDRDEAFGAEMAKKALNNRGILGRLRQKIFSGGQSNNVISVCFQMADWRDGWTDVTPKEEAEPVSESQIDDMIMESILKGV